MPRTPPVVSRRGVLVGGAAVAALGVMATGCGSPPAPPRVDELKAQSALALHDIELADAAIGAADPPTAAALKQVGAERARHARALDTEIARVVGSTSSSVTTSTETTSESTTSAPPAPPPSLADVANALRASADSARQLAITSSGYRAGLLASIAAACTAAFTVALASGEPAP